MGWGWAGEWKTGEEWVGWKEIDWRVWVLDGLEWSLVGAEAEWTWKVDAV